MSANKDDTFWKILDTALELDTKKGHLKWTISDLSRKSGVTRSLIYYYFGRSKTAILNEAIRLIGEELVGLNATRMEMWQQGRFSESLIHARSLRDKAPHIMGFIVEHREKPTDLGESLRQVEADFLKKLKQFFPQLKTDQIAALYGIFFGALFAPIVDQDSIPYIVSAILKEFRSSIP